MLADARDNKERCPRRSFAKTHKPGTEWHSPTYPSKLENLQCRCRVYVASIKELESERALGFATHESIAQFTKTFKNGGEETRGARCTRDKGRGVCLPSHSLHPLEATCNPTWHNAIELTLFYRPRGASFPCTVDGISGTVRYPALLSSSTC